ncbi:hypothetical protein FOZ63_015292 [Perkinsus olseni]|uniref:Telomerase reverse transcriptase n=1 Tax=Perkinsus olseni TaxID=32597 RepID=A0A7J6R0I9_PEROL|nr:hypothetical protein FOZ63_015292 [Perkinsus olseni]
MVTHNQLNEACRLMSTSTTEPSITAAAMLARLCAISMRTLPDNRDLLTVLGQIILFPRRPIAIDWETLMDASGVSHDASGLYHRITQAGVTPSREAWQGIAVATCRAMTQAFGSELAFDLIAGANACFVLVQPETDSSSIIALFGHLKSLPPQLKRTASPSPSTETGAKPDRNLEWSAVLYSPQVFQRGKKMPPAKRLRLNRRNSESSEAQGQASRLGERDPLKLFPEQLARREDFADLPLGAVKQFLSTLGSGLRNRALELLGHWQSDGRFKGLRDAYVFQQIKAIEEFEVEPHEASRVVVQILAETMPQGLLGSEKNRKIVLQNVRKCYALRVGETIGLRSLTCGMQTRGFTSVSQKTAQLYLAEIVWFIFDDVVLPITRMCFYVTEVQDKRVAGRLHYFYKPDWSALCARAARGYVAHVGLRRVEDEPRASATSSGVSRCSDSTRIESPGSSLSAGLSSHSDSPPDSPEEIRDGSADKLSTAFTGYGLSLMPMKSSTTATPPVRRSIRKRRRSGNSCRVRWIPKTKGGMRPIAVPPKNYQSSGRVCHRELIRPIKFSGSLGRSVLDRDQRAGELEEFVRKFPGDSLRVGVYDLKNCYENIRHEDVLAALNRLERPIESLKVLKLYKGHAVTQEVGLPAKHPRRVLILLPNTLLKVALKSATMDRVKRILNNVELVLPHGRYTFDGKGLVQGGTLSPVLCSLALGTSDPLLDAPLFTARLVDDGLLVGMEEQVSKSLEVVKNK